MQGQVEQMLYRAVDIDESLLDHSVSTQHYLVFRQAAVKRGLRTDAKITADIDPQRVWEIEAKNREDQAVASLVKEYFDVSSENWEETFGAFWDSSWKTGS